MADDDEEERSLRSVALQNANAILLARQRAERELIEAKEKLHEQSEWFRVTLGSIGDAVITVDTNSRITFVNPVAENLTGWTSAEAVGLPIGEVLHIVHEETRQPAENPIDRALATGTVVILANHTTLLRRDRTEIPIEDSAAPIKTATGEIIGAVMVFHDVTDRRQREVDLNRSYQAEQDARGAAEQANRAKDQFIAALSHELRTPLTPVLAILSSLTQDGMIPAALAEDLETVRRNVELEARLIDDLLDLTRIARGKLHLRKGRVSTGGVIEDAIKTCLLDLKAKRLILHRQFAEPLPTLLVDGSRVTQILWNLLKNAIKFTPPGGAITIRLRVPDDPRGRELQIEVADTGIGIDPANLERVFQAFEQAERNTARQFGGLGLGLAISKAIAEAHGGTLCAASGGIGKGCTFTLTLPCPHCEDSEPPQPSDARGLPATPTPPSSNVTQRPLRILLVEDHADTAAILSRMLGRMGHEVLHTGNITSALEIADREMQSGRIDLLISDLGLPDGSGQDLMRALSAKYEIKGIALSGYGMESDLEQSTAAGFARHLIKPIDLAHLKTTISELMLG
jgi:PAS domain S-box-containing protein